MLFPSEAGSVRLIDADMVTPGAFASCMGRIDARLMDLGAQLTGIEGRLKRIERVPERWLVVEVVVAVLLIIAQVGTPFLNAAMIHLGP